MAAKRNTRTGKKDTSIGFEARLWLAADSRSAAETAEGNRSNNMDAAEYKHVVLGLIFLKYISDTAGKCRMANAEVRMTNRSRFTSTFEIRQSNE